MHPTNDGREKSRTLSLVVLFGAISVLAGFDLILDLAEGTSFIHLLTEALLFVVGLGGLGIMARRLYRVTREAAELTRQTEELNARTTELAERLEARRAEAEEWRTEARSILRGLGEAIDRQLDTWELTPAEKEVAVLMLKGFSHKEIAELRGTSSATTRQQAGAVYQKGGLSGRNDLSAFFLEDLLLPSQVE